MCWLLGMDETQDNGAMTRCVSLKNRSQRKRKKIGWLHSLFNYWLYGLVHLIKLSVPQVISFVK